MRILRLAAVVIATTLLIGACGPANASTHTLPAQKAPAVWGAIGDSITYGVGTSGANPGFALPSSTSYPAQAGVAGRGFPGQCLVATGCFWDTLVASFPGELAYLQQNNGVTAVVVEIGINDLVRGISDKAYRTGYRQLQAQGAAAGVRVVLSTITPGGRGHFTDVQEAQRERVNDWIRAQGPHVEYAGALGLNVLRAAFDSGDGLHPSNAGARAMADRLDRFITNHPKLRIPTPICVRAPCGVR